LSFRSESKWIKAEIYISDVIKAMQHFVQIGCSKDVIVQNYSKKWDDVHINALPTAYVIPYSFILWK